MNKVTLELDEEDANLFKEYREDYYWFKSLKDEFKKQDVRNGFLNAKFHFTKFGEIAGLDVEQTFSHIKIQIPI